MRLFEIAMLERMKGKGGGGGRTLKTIEASTIEEFFSKLTALITTEKIIPYKFTFEGVIDIVFGENDTYGAVGDEALYEYVFLEDEGIYIFSAHFTMLNNGEQINIIGADGQIVETMGLHLQGGETKQGELDLSKATKYIAHYF